jgi:hypothetical protein
MERATALLPGARCMEASMTLNMPDPAAPDTTASDTAA